MIPRVGVGGAGVTNPSHREETQAEPPDPAGQPTRSVVEISILSQDASGGARAPVGT